MFKNLFKKKAHHIDMDIPEVSPIVISEEDVTLLEESLENEYKFLAITFRDVRTGELHTVAYEDDATFYEMVKNKNMQIVFS